MVEEKLVGRAAESAGTCTGNICEAASNVQVANGVICQLHTAEDYGLDADLIVLGGKGSLQMLSRTWLPGTVAPGPRACGKSVLG